VEVIIAGQPVERGDAGSSGGRGKAQLPQGERALLSAIIAAAAVSGAVVGASEAEEPAAATPSVTSSTADTSPDMSAVRDQFQAAFTPGAAWENPQRMDIRIENGLTR
jgi:hypothetical protein